MPVYRAPVADIRFVLHELLAAERHYRATGYADATRDTIDAIVDGGAQFASGVLAPLRRIGDEQGSHVVNGGVKTPAGSREAYRAYVDGGWASMAIAPEWGGQGLPHSLNIVFHEMCLTANVSLFPVATLTHGAIRAIEAHASDELKQRYLPKLASGEWTGTMCLTEPHAGSDVGLVRVKAEPQADGSYALTGTKMFITYADHDLAENIVHLVLARLPDAPAGPKGISLFLVPKFLPDADGNPGRRNPAVVQSVEEKMGLKASPTCVLNFDGATGWLVGKPHNGLAAMFTMMNAARLDVGTEGLAAAQLSLQGALDYAQERLQMRSATGAKAPDKYADPIIVHPDVRRMLLTQKALTEGMRALAYTMAFALDEELHHPDPLQRQAGSDLVALLTPIVKGFLTEHGLEAAILGQQVFGGHGYIREWGMEQIVRDVRIALIYEGTNGIQAQDLLRRKVIGSDGRLLRLLSARMQADAAKLAGDEVCGVWANQVQALAAEWEMLADTLIARARDDAESVGAAAFDFAEYSGYVVLAWLWLRMAALGAAQPGSAFHQAKVHTARFYFERLLPRTRAFVANIEAGPASLMTISGEQLGAMY
ncbi:MAG: acyl-CoA dehydrogenase C-terminal domain-containing protein [Gammaproteobacteria bacterium]